MLRRTNFGYQYDNGYRSPVCTEDVIGIPWAERPHRLLINTFRGRAVSQLRPISITRPALGELERAILDQGWRYGVKRVAVTLEYDRVKGAQIVAEITYA